MTDTSKLTPEREKQLVHKVQRGDRGALGELLAAYHKRIYHQCLRMIGNSDDAAEITQDAMMKAVQHVDGFHAKSRFSTWLFRIAMNLAISHLRRAKVRRAMSLDDNTKLNQATPLKAIIASNREQNPQQCVENNEQHGLLLDAVSQLDVSLRAVILLRDLQDMDYKSISDVLGLPIGTVKSRLFRARLSLRQMLVKDASSEAEVSDG